MTDSGVASMKALRPPGRLWLGLSGLFALGLATILAVAVADNTGPLQAWDQHWHEYLRQTAIDHPGWLSTMRVVTAIGATPTVAVVDACLFALSLWQRRYRTAAFAAVIGVGGWALRLGILSAVARPRPDHALWDATGYSFPSGHTTNATLMLILIGVVAWPALRSAGRRGFVVGATILALAVALSRVVGGVHWPTDVLGGLLLAIGYASVVRALFP
jgi:undecaprenyl-diphosphatase